MVRSSLVLSWRETPVTSVSAKSTCPEFLGDVTGVGDSRRCRPGIVEIVVIVDGVFGEISRLRYGKGYGCLYDFGVVGDTLRKAESKAELISTVADDIGVQQGKYINSSDLFCLLPSSLYV
jgi:hypothetical protein